jgi:hypothetical protein
MKIIYKIKYFSLIGVLLVLNFQCEMDNLTVNPTDQYSADTFWKSDVQARAGLTGCYNVLYDGYVPLIGNGQWDILLDWLTPNMVSAMTLGYDAIVSGVLTSLPLPQWIL